MDRRYLADLLFAAAQQTGVAAAVGTIILLAPHIGEDKAILCGLLIGLGTAVAAAALRRGVQEMGPARGGGDVYTLRYDNQHNASLPPGDEGTATADGRTYPSYTGALYAALYLTAKGMPWVRITDSKGQVCHCHGPGPEGDSQP